MNDYQPQSESTEKWKIISFFLILVIIINIGFSAYTYFDLKSKSLDIQTNFLSLQEQFRESQESIQRIQQQIEISTSTNQSNLLTKIYNLVKDSVVIIETRFGQGSGFVYDTFGRIITNYHVIEDADEIKVSFTSGIITKANIIGVDPHSDLAVIEVNVPYETLHPLVLGDSFALDIGESVVAIGSPYGLHGTITSGIISQVERELSAPEGYKIIDVIQIDAPINPGNSGGPLVNMKGEVIGITTAIIGGSTGVGFAIPSKTIEREIQSLITTGKYAHPWMGITGNGVDPYIADALGLEHTYGILIAGITNNSPAERAGLRGGDRTVNIGGKIFTVGGDLIVGLNNLSIRKFNDLSVYLERNTKPGDTIILTIIRDQKQITKELVLSERP